MKLNIAFGCLFLWQRKEFKSNGGVFGGWGRVMGHFSVTANHNVKYKEEYRGGVAQRLEKVDL